MPERPSKYTGIVGRRVDFTGRLPLSWGIEIEVPFNPEVKESLQKKYRIVIPERINTFMFLDLNPQESLPPDKRNIDYDFDWFRTNLENLVVSGRGSIWADNKRRRTIENFFFSILALHQKQTEKFNSIIAKCTGNTLLVVEGHSWSAPWIIGEQGYNLDKDPELNHFQKSGNKVAVKKIIEKYNDPSRISAIFFYACYNGERKIKGLDVPLVYRVGPIGEKFVIFNSPPPVIVEPKQKFDSPLTY